MLDVSRKLYTCLQEYPVLELTKALYLQMTHACQIKTALHLFTML